MTREAETWRMFAAAAAGGMCADPNTNHGSIVSVACEVADELTAEFLKRFGTGAPEPPADLPDPPPPPRRVG